MKFNVNKYKALKLIIVSVILLVFVFMGLYEPGVGHKTSKALITESKLSAIGKACNLYYQHYGIVPHSLDQLCVTNPESICYIPFDNNYGNLLIDSWGNHIHIISHSNNMQWVEIISYGSDARPGGRGRGRGDDLIQTQHLSKGSTLR